MSFWEQHKLNLIIGGILAILFILGYSVTESEMIHNGIMVAILPCMALLLKLQKTDNHINFNRELGKSPYLPLLYLAGLGIAAILLLIWATKLEQSL